MVDLVGDCTGTLCIFGHIVIAQLVEGAGLAQPNTLRRGVLTTLPGTIVVHRSPGGTMGYLGAAEETHGQDLQSTTEEDGTEPTRVGLIYGL